MSDLGRVLIVFGVVLVIVGTVLMLFGRIGLPRLPGDILIRRDGFTFYFPIVTSIVVSLILTLLLNLLFVRR
jgi:multisubunit Na+/H+ antiporter MnhG subunit